MYINIYIYIYIYISEIQFIVSLSWNLPGDIICISSSITVSADLQLRFRPARRRHLETPRRPWPTLLITLWRWATPIRRRWRRRRRRPALDPDDRWRQLRLSVGGPPPFKRRWSRQEQCRRRLRHRLFRSRWHRPQSDRKRLIDWSAVIDRSKDRHTAPTYDHRDRQIRQIDRSISDRPTDRSGRSIGRSPTDRPTDKRAVFSSAKCGKCIPSMSFQNVDDL